MQKSKLSKFKVWVLACSAAVAVTSVTPAAHAADNPYAGNIRGTYSGTLSGSYLICIQQDSRIIASVENSQLGSTVLVGQIAPTTGAFSAEGSSNGVGVKFTGTATLDASEPGVVSGTGTYEVTMGPNTLTGSFSGKGLLEKPNGFSITGRSYYHYVSPTANPAVSSQLPDSGRYVRLFKGSRLVGITYTLEDGTYSFSGRENGDYRVTVQPPGEYVNPVHPITVNGANRDNINFRSIGVYAYVLDESGAPLPGVPVRLTGDTTAGYRTEQTLDTHETTLRAAFYVGKGSFLVKPKAQEGFIFEPRSVVISTPGGGVSKPAVRVKFIRKVAPSSTLKAKAKSGNSF